MPRRFYLISHPNVVVEPTVPVPEWSLSAIGLERMKRGLGQPWIKDITAVYSSTERKAIETAEVLAEHLDLSIKQNHALGENDRSSTGFLPPPEFEAMANAFFANPETSIRGWERAVDAQRRVIEAIQSIAAGDSTSGPIAIVSHGAVGTLLYCHLARKPISREWDQPPNGGGNFYEFELGASPRTGWWQAIDRSAA